MSLIDISNPYNPNNQLIGILSPFYKLDLTIDDKLYKSVIHYTLVDTACGNGKTLIERNANDIKVIKQAQQQYELCYENLFFKYLKLGTIEKFKEPYRQQELLQLKGLIIYQSNDFLLGGKVEGEKIKGKNFLGKALRDTRDYYKSQLIYNHLENEQILQRGRLTQAYIKEKIRKNYLCQFAYANIPLSEVPNKDDQELLTKYVSIWIWNQIKAYVSTRLIKERRQLLKSKHHDWSDDELDQKVSRRVTSSERKGAINQYLIDTSIGMGLSGDNLQENFTKVYGHILELMYPVDIMADIERHYQQKIIRIHSLDTSDLSIDDLNKILYEECQEEVQKSISRKSIQEQMDDIVFREYMAWHLAYEKSIIKKIPVDQVDGHILIDKLLELDEAQDYLKFFRKIALEAYKEKNLDEMLIGLIDNQISFFELEEDNVDMDQIAEYLEEEKKIEEEKIEEKKIEEILEELLEKKERKEPSTTIPTIGYTIITKKDPLFMINNSHPFEWKGLYFPTLEYFVYFQLYIHYTGILNIYKAYEILLKQLPYNKSQIGKQTNFNAFVDIHYLIEKISKFKEAHRRDLLSASFKKAIDYMMRRNEFKDILITTGTAKLVFHCEDDFLGITSKGTGLDFIGNYLTSVRDEYIRTHLLHQNMIRYNPNYHILKDWLQLRSEEICDITIALMYYMLVSTRLNLYMTLESQNQLFMNSLAYVLNGIFIPCYQLINDKVLIISENTSKDYVDFITSTFQKDLELYGIKPNVIKNVSEVVNYIWTHINFFSFILTKGGEVTTQHEWDERLGNHKKYIVEQIEQMKTDKSRFFIEECFATIIHSVMMFTNVEKLDRNLMELCVKMLVGLEESKNVFEMKRVYYHLLASNRVMTFLHKFIMKDLEAMDVFGDMVMLLKEYLKKLEREDMERYYRVSSKILFFYEKGKISPY